MIIKKVSAKQEWNVNLRELKGLKKKTIVIIRSSVCDFNYFSKGLKKHILLVSYTKNKLFIILTVIFQLVNYFKRINRTITKNKTNQLLLDSFVHKIYFISLHLTLLNNSFCGFEHEYFFNKTTQVIFIFNLMLFFFCVVVVVMISILKHKTVLKKIMSVQPQNYDFSLLFVCMVKH